MSRLLTARRGLRAASAAVGLVVATACAIGCRGFTLGPTPSYLAPPTPAATSAPDVTPIDWTAYGEVLDACVTSEGRVDYFHLAQPPHYPKLESLYARLAAFRLPLPPEPARNREAQLAYYINAHNLLALMAVAPKFAPGVLDPKHVSDLSAPPETGFVFTLGGQRLTLRQIRRQRVVPLLAGDPRPLLTLCAGRRNDPPLRREPYQADRLESQLADQFRRSLHRRPWCEVDFGARKVRLAAGINEYREYYWTRYLSDPGHRREGVGFLTVLLDLTDDAGRRWLNHGLGFAVVTAEPADEFNNKPLFRAGAMN